MGIESGGGGGLSSGQNYDSGWRNGFEQAAEARADLIAKIAGAFAQAAAVFSSATFTVKNPTQPTKQESNGPFADTSSATGSQTGGDDDLYNYAFVSVHAEIVGQEFREVESIDGNGDPVTTKEIWWQWTIKFALVDGYGNALPATDYDYKFYDGTFGIAASKTNESAVFSVKSGPMEPYKEIWKIKGKTPVGRFQVAFILEFQEANIHVSRFAPTTVPFSIKTVPIERGTMVPHSMSCSRP